MKKHRKLYVEGLEARRVLAASLGWDGPGAGSANLTYSIDNAPASLDQAAVNSAIETALNAWSQGVDVDFTQTNIGHNLAHPTDVNSDTLVSALDALLVINNINSGGALGDGNLCDTNNDGLVSAVDVLLVINDMNRPEGESAIVLPPQEDPNLAPALDDNLDGDVEDPVVSGLDDSADDPNTLDDTLPDESDSGDDANEALDDDPATDEEDSGATAEGDGDRPILLGLGLERFGIGHRLGGLREAAVDSLFENFDENGDQSLTEDELPGFLWDYILRQGVDADEDGMVTLQEINTAIETKKLERFNRLDEDGDGLLGESELSARQWERLARADANQDGGISYDELNAFQNQTRFERLDKNSDGGITEDEVAPRLWDRLSQHDENDDGVISNDELPYAPHPQRVLNEIGRVAAFVSRVLRGQHLRF